MESLDTIIVKIDAAIARRKRTALMRKLLLNLGVLLGCAGIGAVLVVVTP